MLEHSTQLHHKAIFWNLTVKIVSKQKYYFDASATGLLRRPNTVPLVIWTELWHEANQLHICWCWTHKCELNDLLKFLKVIQMWCQMLSFILKIQLRTSWILCLSDIFTCLQIIFLSFQIKLISSEDDFLAFSASGGFGICCIVGFVF